MKNSLKLLLGCVVSAICLWLVLRNVPISKVLVEIRQADPAWFFAGFLLFLLSMGLRSLRWTIILSSLKKMPVSIVAPHLVFGFFMNNVLPARAGEALRAASLARQQSLTFGSVFGTVFFERFFDLMGFFMIVLLSSALLPWKLLPVSKLLLVLCAGLVVLALIVAYRQRLATHAATRGGILGKIASFVADATASFVTLKSARKMLLVLTLSVIIWLNEAFQLFIIARAMHLILNYLESAAVLTGFSIGVMLPAAPGFVGTYEFFGNQMLLFLGKNPIQSISFVFALHAYQLVATAVLGVISMYFVSKSDRALRASQLETERIS
jgi:uncharacterized protein (TIRG00374 family)